jgi:hypothetical protein
MSRWPTRVRQVPAAQLRILRTLAEHLMDEGAPFASEPMMFPLKQARSLAVLADYALVEKLSEGEWVLTWRGRGYLGALEASKKR